jgi:hypothetical protein
MDKVEAVWREFEGMNNAMNVQQSYLFVGLGIVQLTGGCRCRVRVRVG